MAITKTHYELFKSLRLPQGGALLEIGEANWYGDIDPASVGLPKCESQFDTCKAFYAQTFAPEKCVAIDMNGSPEALRHDLNLPVPIDEQFDVVINHGTAEHIFNIGQVFATIHDRCAVGGVMVHDAPLTGWIDHGFYCLHPTLFYDIAAANCYEVMRVAVHELRTARIIPVDRRDDLYGMELPNNAMLFVALKKLFDLPFRVPIQGYYAQSLSLAGVRAWERRTA